MKCARLRSLFGILSVLLAITAAPSLGMPLCTISNATPLAFGTIGAADRWYDGRASFVVTCSRTQTTTISLLYSHRMKSGTKGPDLMYDLYATLDRSSVWGGGGDGPSLTQTFAAGSPVLLYIYARIAPHQQPAPGLFSDNIDIVTMP